MHHVYAAELTIIMADYRTEESLYWELWVAKERNQGACNHTHVFVVALSSASLLLVYDRNKKGQFAEDNCNIVTLCKLWFAVLCVTPSILFSGDDSPQYIHCFLAKNVGQYKLLLTEVQVFSLGFKEETKSKSLVPVLHLPRIHRNSSHRMKPDSKAVWSEVFLP